MKKRVFLFLTTMALILSLAPSGFALNQALVSVYPRPLSFSESTSDKSEDISVAAAKTKAIVILPGILGSSLEDADYNVEVWLSVANYARMKLNENGTSINNIQSVNYDNYGANNTYKALYDYLNSQFKNYFDIIFFDYDWRMSNTSAATKLASELSSYSEVILVAHSMGGLVASKFIANSAANRAKTKAVITIGTPYVGSAKCINVMETGDLISADIFAFKDVILFQNTVKSVCKNSFAAYQLLPTTKYSSIVGFPALYVNGTSYNTMSPPLNNTAWGKTSSGSTKPQFSTATSFHNSLFNAAGTHVKEWSGVPWYTYAGTGIDTISQISYNSDYTVDDIWYNNAGDGTVMMKSAGYGFPYKTYAKGTDSEHSNLVKSAYVLLDLASHIRSISGITKNSNDTCAEYSLNEPVFQTNARGWLQGTDNRRINVYTDCDAILLYGGLLVDESQGILCDTDGKQIGTVWSLGDSGRKMYALYSENYQLETDGDVIVKYMDNGYYEKIEEYAIEEIPVLFTVGDCNSQDVLCVSAITSYSHNDLLVIAPTRVYSESELAQLNQD